VSWNWIYSFHFILRMENIYYHNKLLIVSPVFNCAPRHADIWRSGGIAPQINLRTKWRWVISFTPQPFYPEDRGCVDSTVGLDVVSKRRILPLPEIEPRPSSPKPSHFTDWATPHHIVTLAMKANKSLLINIYGLPQPRDMAFLWILTTFCQV
jgi:hypothetical protein